MLRCHSVPDCSSPSSHRRGHPCRKTFGIFACFPSLNLLMQKHIMNSGQKFCLVVIFRSPSSSNLVFLLLCIWLHGLYFHAFSILDMAEPCLCMVSTMCCHKPQKQTNSATKPTLRNSATELRNSPAGAHQMAMFTLPTKAGTSHLSSLVGWNFQFGVRWIRLLLNEEGSKNKDGFLIIIPI